jgi:ABC-2 type transport system ATP-binding protein
MNALAVSAHQLSKSFRRPVKAGRFRRTHHEVTAVDAVDLSINVGEFVALIGPNGAGKSTTVKMLTGILAPSSGSLHVLDMVPLDERKQLASRLGVVFGQRSQLWWDLPLIESFGLLRHLYGLSHAAYRESFDDLCDRFALAELLSAPVRTLSLGQRMRAEVAAVLLHRPELLFLDEPTIGLDVVAKYAMRDALRTMHREHGTTIVLTTHDLSDVDQLCERVVIIDHGHIIRDCPIDTLRNELPDVGSDLETIVRHLYDPR